jgi:hypothetical protein
MLRPFAVLLLLLLGSCKWKPEYDDPEKQARYEAYYNTVQVEINRYSARSAKSSAPWFVFLRRHNPEVLIDHEVGDDQKPPVDTQKIAKQFASAVSAANRSSDQNVRLVGLFAYHLCKIPLDTIPSDFLEDEDFRRQHAIICPAITGIRYRTKGLESFDRLIPALIPIYIALEDEDRAIDLTPLADVITQHPKWFNTERSVANTQLQIWRAAQQVKPVPVPDEFKEREVRTVDIVLGNYRRNFFGVDQLLVSDIYALIGLMPCQWQTPPENELEPKLRACQQIASHIAEHTQSLAAIQDAHEILGSIQHTIKEKSLSIQFVSNPNVQKRLDYLKLHKALEKRKQLLSNAIDLKELKRRITIIRQHGSLRLFEDSTSQAFVE